MRNTHWLFQTFYEGEIYCDLLRKRWFPYYKYAIIPATFQWHILLPQPCMSLIKPWNSKSAKQVGQTNTDGFDHRSSDVRKWTQQTSVLYWRCWFFDQSLKLQKCKTSELWVTTRLEATDTTRSVIKVFVYNTFFLLQVIVVIDVGTSCQLLFYDDFAQTLFTTKVIEYKSCVELFLFSVFNTNSLVNDTFGSGKKSC